MKYLLFTIFTFFLSACVQKIANPEQLDEIYKDLVLELGIVSKSLAMEEKNLIDVSQERLRVVPQTGQIKFSNKRLADANEKINVLRQQVQYFEIKIEQRVALAKARYEESLHAGGRAWPDAEEVALYNAVTKFNRNKLEWERTRGLKKLVPRGTTNGLVEKK